MPIPDPIPIIALDDPIKNLCVKGNRCRVDRRNKGDVYVNYNLYGTGEKKVLFVMGLNGTGSHWILQAEYFGALEDYQVCLFDNRGIGQSSAPPGPYSTKIMALDAIELLDHLGWEENVHLVGVSMGGMIAQIMSIRQPKRFSTVTFTSTYNSTAMVMPTPGDVSIFYKMTARSRQGLVRPLLKVCFPKAWLEQEVRPGVTNFKCLEDASNRLAETSPHQTMAGEQAQLVSALLHSVPPYKFKAVKKAGVRCLVLHGTKDKVIRSASGSLLASFLSCPLVLFRNSGHMLMIERTSEYNALLRAHFEGLPLDTFLKKDECLSPYIGGAKKQSPLIFSKGTLLQNAEKEGLCEPHIDSKRSDTEEEYSDYDVGHNDYEGKERADEKVKIEIVSESETAQEHRSESSWLKSFIPSSPNLLRRKNSNPESDSQSVKSRSSSPQNLSRSSSTTSNFFTPGPKIKRLLLKTPWANFIHHSSPVNTSSHDEKI